MKRILAPGNQYRMGIYALSLFFLYGLTAYFLQSSLDYPEILVESASYALPLFAQGEIKALLGFGGLLISGILLIILSTSLAQHLERRARKAVFWTGCIGGSTWILVALGWLALALLRNTSVALQIYHPTGLLELAIYGMVAPILLAYWTVTISQMLQAHQNLGLVGAAGLILVFLRSLVWILNGLLPIQDGYFGTAEIFSLLAVLGQSLWLAWLFLLGIRLIGQPVEQATRPVSQGPGWPEKGNNRSRQRSALKWGKGLVLLIAGLVFVLGYSAITVLAAPAVQRDSVPSEPSLTGSLLNLSIWVYAGEIHPIHTVQDMLSQPPGVPKPLPAGISLEKISALGVPAQLVCAPGAAKSEMILYLHGGGFAAPLNDQYRSYASELSRDSSACVLLPEYRLTPKYPFPAGLQDCVMAYRWLLSQGVAPEKIVIMGDSAGANLALATALSLKDDHEALPAALVAISAPTDLTMAGSTYRTKAAVDPILGHGLPQDAYDIYTDHNPAELQNPLVSPLYADVRGLPPTLLLVGTQEVLLSDSQRMVDRMRAAGVQVRLEVWPGMWHTWPLVGDFLPDARLATQHIVTFIRMNTGD